MHAHACVTDHTVTIQLAIEIYCWNHLRNFWFGGMPTALTKHMKTELKHDLSDVDRKLRVQVKVESIIMSVFK